MGRPVRRGYLASFSGGTAYIQWQRHSGHVHGSVSESYFNASDPTHLRAQSLTVNGTIAGSDALLHLSDGVTWHGTLSSSGLSISYTASDGSIKTVDFRPASVADYNAAVARTKGDVSRARRRQATEQEVDSAASTLSTADQSLQEDTSSLDADTFGADISSIHEDVASVQGDLQTVKTDTPDVACDDAGVASDDAGVAANDAGVLNNDVQVYAGDAGRVRSDIAAVLYDYRRLVRASKAAPAGYAAPNTPDAVAVGADVRQGRAALKAELRRVAAAKARAVQLVAQAREIAAQAHSIGCR